jgi:hypothetical protein
MAVDSTSAPEGTPSESTVDATASDHLGEYHLVDEVFGTDTTVTLGATTRTIVTNALPDHETGEFPNPGNPNAITAQDLTWVFPLEPVIADAPGTPRVPGVAVNGVKFEPGTAETVTCATGETYRVEALQDTYDLGFDDNNAHVQPTGEYHYHGLADLLVATLSVDGDLAHLGFAADGHLIHHSLSDAHRSGWSLSTTPRTGTDCVPSLRGADTIDLEGTTPDGTYTSDWVWSADTGDLDECNGTTIDGTYTYLITDDFPFIPRCLIGEFTPERPGP